MEKASYTPTMDLERMKTQVHAKAELILAEVNEDNLNYFLGEVKKIAKSTFEDYAFKVYDLYTSGERAIHDINQLEQFVNTDTGYQQRMLQWEDEHDVSITKNGDSMPTTPDAPSQSGENTDHLTTLGVGFAIATGFVLLRHPIIAIAVELLTLCLAYSQKKSYSTDMKEQPSDSQSPNKEDISTTKERFLKGVICEIEQWLKEGEKYSNELLASFNL